MNDQREQWNEVEYMNMPIPQNRTKAAQNRNTKRKRARRRRIAKVCLKIMVVLGAVLMFVAVASFVKGLFPNMGIGQVYESLSNNVGKTKVNKEMWEKLEEEKAQYPPRFLEALENNEELIDFVLGYPEKIGTYDESIKVSDDEERGIPLFLQWDERWGYASYGEGCIGLDGCGPTCLSMVLVGLTGDASYHPKAVADFSVSNGFVTETSGTQWALMTDGAAAFGLQARELSLGEQQMARELEAGHPIICSVRPGDFTTTGHFIVIYKYEEGKFYVNDPNSKKRSELGYDYDRLSVQIKAMWVYEY